MKIYNQFVALLAAGLVMTSCSMDISEEGYTPAQKESDGIAAAYFPGNYARTVELEPGTTSFDVTVSRLNATSAGSVSITVVNDESGVFDVPSTVNFAAGEKTATLTINAPRAAEGVNYPLTIAISEQDRSLYTNGYREVSIDFAILKWEKVGTGYLLDGTVGYFWGVDNTLPLAIELEHCTTATGERFRYYSPFAYLCETMDDAGIGYVGYPYNEEGDCDEEDHLVVINISSKGAWMNTHQTGMDWGYGMISIGSSDYGEYDEKNGVITFPKETLFISMADYKSGEKYDCDIPTLIYTSAEAYLKSLGGDEDEDEDEE